MAPHDEIHPEPEEGCRECAHTPRRSPFEGKTIDEVLERAYPIMPVPTEEQTAASRERLYRKIAEVKEVLEGESADPRPDWWAEPRVKEICRRLFGAPRAASPEAAPEQEGEADAAHEEG